RTRQSSRDPKGSRCVKLVSVNTVKHPATQPDTHNGGADIYRIQRQRAPMLRRASILRINHIAAINGWLKARPDEPARSLIVVLPQPGRDRSVAPAARLPGGGAAPCC